MNIQEFQNGESLSSVRSKINSNFISLKDVINNVCNDSANDNPIRTCLSSDFSNPCDNSNLSNSLLSTISTQLGSSMSAQCPDPGSANVPSCEALAPLQNGISAMLSNISNQIGAALSSDCPSNTTPSCGIYQPIYNGSSSLASNIVNNISLSISNPCSSSPPSCPIYSPLYSAQSTFADKLIQTAAQSINDVFTQDPCALLNSQTVPISGPLASCVSGGVGLQIGVGMRGIMEQGIQTVVESINDVFTQDPCALLNSQTVPISGPLASCVSAGVGLQIGVGMKGIMEQGIQTVVESINDVFTQDPCALLNSQTVPISGPLASCVSAGVGLQIGAGMKNIITNVVSSVFTTVQNVLSAQPCDILNGNAFNLAGPLSSCLSGNSSISFGGGFRSLIENSVQTAINTVLSALQNPCQAMQLNSTFPCGLNINIPDTNSIIDNMMSSACIVDKIIDFIETNQGRILTAALATPMASEGENSIKGLVDYLSCELFEKFIDTGGNTPDACVSDSILKFVDNKKCELFEKFIDTVGGASDPCIKDSILEFVKINSCDLIGKINEMGASLCQEEFNILIDDIMCGYLADFDNQGLIGMQGLTPKGCALRSANKIIKEYAPLFYVSINGVPRQMKIPTEMKVNMSNLSVEPQYYDVNGNPVP